jgi:hypothetical protein
MLEPFFQEIYQNLLTSEAVFGKIGFMDINKYIKPFKYPGIPFDTVYFSGLTLNVPYYIMLKCTFATHAHWGDTYPFGKMIYRELLDSKSRHVLSMIVSLSNTNRWVLKPEFTYKEQFTSFPAPFRYHITESKKFAKLVFQYHPEIYFRLHKLDHELLNYTESKEEALIAAITKKMMGG